MPIIEHNVLMQKKVDKGLEIVYPITKDTNIIDDNGNKINLLEEESITVLKIKASNSSKGFIEYPKGFFMDNTYVLGVNKEGESTLYRTVVFDGEITLNLTGIEITPKYVEESTYYIAIIRIGKSIFDIPIVD